MTGIEPHAWETGRIDTISYVGLDVDKATVSVAVAASGRRGAVRQVGVFANRPEILLKLAARLSNGDRDRVPARATAGRVLSKARQHLQSFLLRHDQIYRRGRADLGAHPSTRRSSRPSPPIPARACRLSMPCSATSKPGSSAPIIGVSATPLPRSLREWSYRCNRRNLPDGLDGDPIRRAVDCATLTYDQLKAGAMPGGANRVSRFLATIRQRTLTA
jgi:hypothetical protein